jgi:O-acetyl-ADP-ribose deacetylase (regulator of RNase III)
MIQYINGDLLDNDSVTHIVHQCNCKTSYPKGLAEFIFDKYPAANDYANVKNRTPGTINIHQVGVNKFVVNMFAQNSPGKPSFYETKDLRLKWFKSCLDKLCEYANDKVVFGFPYLIGCGLAGGDWDNYERLIKEFSDKVADKKAQVLIIKLTK